MQTNTTTTQNGAGQTTTDTTDARPLNELTKFQRDLLRTITALNEPSGVDIQDALESAYGEEITRPRIYMALNGLVESGFIEKGKIDHRTNSYALTDEGERAFSAHLRWMCSTGGDA